MKNEIILFENQNVKLEVNMKDETVWLNREQLAILFDRDIKTIGKHINNALNEELDNSTVAKFATVQKEGNREVTRNIEYYNLIGNIYQTFDGDDVYKSIEEKASNFLYMIVKNHVFIDGNKRIAATLFIYFLNHYGILYKDDKEVIDNNTLAALTLLIAESNPKEKEVIVDLVMNFLN